MQILQYFAKYGTQTTFYFAMEDGSSSTDAYTGTDVVAADSAIVKDGGASAATTNAVSTTRSPTFALTLTATEMQATEIVVRITDASAAVFKDVILHIRTTLAVGQLDADASQMTNQHGIKATGSGTGNGVLATGGATGVGIKGLGGSTSGDGAVFSGTAGNSNGLAVTGVGTGKGLNATGASAAYYNNILDQLEGTEPSAALGSNATFREIMQWVKRRFNNKSTVDSTYLKVYKDDSTTVLSSQSVADDGTTDTVGKAS